MVVDIAQQALTDQYKPLTIAREGAAGPGFRGEAGAPARHRATETKVVVEGHGAGAGPRRRWRPATSTSAGAARRLDTPARTARGLSPSRRADFFFMYGQFDEARKRFIRSMHGVRRSGAGGYKAWGASPRWRTARNNVEREPQAGRSGGAHEELRG